MSDTTSTDAVKPPTLGEVQYYQLISGGRESEFFAITSDEQRAFIGALLAANWQPSGQHPNTLTLTAPADVNVALFHRRTA